VHSGIFFEESSLLFDDFLDLLGLGRQTELVEFNLTETNRIVDPEIIVFHSNVENHVLEPGNIFKGKCLVVLGVELVLLFGGLLLAVVLVKDEFILLQFEFDVRIGLAETIFVGKILDPIENNGEDTHDGDEKAKRDLLLCERSLNLLDRGDELSHSRSFPVQDWVRAHRRISSQCDIDGNFDTFGQFT